MLASAIPRTSRGRPPGLLKHMWFVLPLTWFIVAGACNAIKLTTAPWPGGGTAIMFAGLESPRWRRSDADRSSS
jgi:hypothetical protein